MPTTSKLRQQFKQLRDEYLTVSEELRRNQRAIAPNFNIFGLCRLDELGHSTFLANLLNPQGSHGQGNLFLRHFLDHCRRRFDSDSSKIFVTDHDILDTKWEVTTEQSILPFGRLDIVIANLEHGIMIVIENKIGAEERQYQLRDYGAWMASQKEQYPHQALLFLTPHGGVSFTNDGSPYYRFSYRHDVAGFLKRANAEVEAVRLKGTIAQYLDLITEENVNTLDEFERFLCQPDNLPIAIEVARQLERLRDQLHARFWVALEEEMKRRLRASEYADRWEIRSPEGNHRDGWLNCQIVPNPENGGGSLAVISFQQHRPQSAYRLHYGIAWRGDREHPVHLPEYQALQQHLSSRELTPRQEGWWIFGTGAGFSPVGDRFLLRMGLREEEFIREMVNLPWNLFRDTVALLEALNQAAHL